MDISVIIPIYNVEDYLKPCLDSVQSNVRKLDAEVLLVDDGSTDNSGKMAEAYADSHKKFHCLHKENGGLSSARNYGVAHAKGDYIFFVDSDDVITEGILEKMLRSAKTYQTDMTICDVAKLENGKTTTSDIHLRAFFNLKGTVTHVSQHPNLVYDSTAWNKLIRREFYQSHGFEFPLGKLYEDIPVMLPVHYQANKVSVVHQTGYLWRVRSGGSKSITQSYKERKSLWDKIEMMEWLLNYVDENVAEPEIRKALENKSVKVDFTGFINNLDRMERDDAMEFLEHIAEFVEKNISKEVLDNLNLFHRQMYAYILDRDLDRLNQLTRYKHGNMAQLPIVKTENGYEFKVREEFFTVPGRGIERNYVDDPPRCMIDTVELSGKVAKLKGHIYTRRINILPGTQTISAYLLNDYTGKTMELSANSCNSEYLTAEFGSVLNNDDYQNYHYNHDGAGFEVELNLPEIWENQMGDGECFVFLRYDNPIYQGERILRGVKSAVKNKLKPFRFEKDGFVATIVFDRRDTLIVRLKKIEEERKERSDRKRVKFRKIVRQQLRGK